MNLESGAIISSAFTEENLLFVRARRKKQIDRKVRRCKACSNMNIAACTENAPGYGNLLSPIMLVGQSLCTACMSTYIPFTKGSGYMIDAALHLSGLRRWEIFITNLLHCHPPRNRASTVIEKRNCSQYLVWEIDLVMPKLVVALGTDAKIGLEALFARNKRNWANIKLHHVKHPAYYLRTGWEDAKDWVVKLSLEMDKYKNG